MLAPAFFIFVKSPLKEPKKIAKGTIRSIILDKELTTMLTDLQKAELYLKNKDMTFKYKEKESGISMNTLKKYITLPQRLKKASWSNVTKLARLYDDEVEKKKLKNFSPKDVAEFMDWMNENIPEDFYGKKLRKIILENKEIYLQLIEK